MKTESEVKKNVTKDIHIKILEDSLYISASVVNRELRRIRDKILRIL